MKVQESEREDFSKLPVKNTKWCLIKKLKTTKRIDMDIPLAETKKQHFLVLTTILSGN